jgi:hypothetical protein
MRATGRFDLDQRGAALFSALVMLGMFSALIAAYAMNVRAAISLRGEVAQRRVGFYASEAGLNIGIGRFANIFRDNGIPEEVDFAQQVDLGDRTVQISLASVPDCTPCAPTQIPAGEIFAGLKTIPYRYTVQSYSAENPGDKEAHVAGEFDIHTIPIFQFLAFIDSNLFIMPLPNMTLHGRLHTNSDLYMQPDATLRIEDQPPDIANVQVTAGGDVYRGGYKYDDSWRCWGDLYIDKLEDTASPFGDLDPKPMDCQSTAPLGDDVLAGWKGSIKSRVENIITPEVGIIDRGSGEYWKRADLRIVLRLDAAPVAIDFGAADLCLGGPGTLTSPALFPIEVQSASGLQDAARTRQLWRFLCERRGALFYTDVPNVAPDPPDNDSATAVNRDNYTPPFADDGANGNLRVYRRAGEDTTGNGSLSLSDRNDDTCAVGLLLEPWWNPPTCPWPNTAPVRSSWFNDMDYRRGGFYNHREQQWMYLLNLNLRALIEWNEVNGGVLFAPDDDTDGGLVFFLTVQGPNSGAAENNYGVRIFDSADLDTRNVTFPPGLADPTGLAVVSDQAILVEGNYNKRDKVPASIMGDAIWILSQGWEVPSNSGNMPNDLKSVYDLDTGRRDVPSQDSPGGPNGQASFSSSTALAINAAFLFGLGPSTRDPDWYNGGLENFPSFLESWDNRTLNYRGSFVSLGEPQHKRAEWACGSGDSCNGTGVYDPPTRAYDYDADFNRVELLPPMTPKFVYVQQRLYTRIFD